MSEEKKGLQSIRIIKAEDLPSETRVKKDLPDTGFIEMRMERNSDPEPRFSKYSPNKIKNLREELSGKNLLL